MPVKRKINPGLAKLNAERKAKAALKRRQEKAKKKAVSEGLALPYSPEEIQVSLEKRMASIPDDNPVKIACKAVDFDPLAELIDLAQSPKTDRKMRVEINKYLVDKIAPNLKAVSSETRSKLQLTVKVQSFKDASQEALKEAHKVVQDEITDADYDEFDTPEDET